jgi:histidyl-tRNA synthetase
MENLSSLLGKYGEEGDKLIFKILNSGDFLSKLHDSKLKNSDSLHLSNLICEKGLRYDLTVPFARFVVQHRNEITFPFKRYQIQPVWRADRPQKGRYREFYQCDADTIGSDSLLNEAELIKIVDLVFEKIKIPVIIKLNNRKILAGIAEKIGELSKLTEITVALDKIDKIGVENVTKELLENGISSSAIKKIQPILQLKGTGNEKIAFLEDFLKESIPGQKGLEELKTVLYFSSLYSLSNELEFDITLARGLNYYTGAIIEVKSKEISMGSLCGGGRYDDLTGIFGLPGVSGVGVSFGADRIYDIMEQMKIFPETAGTQTKVLFVNFGVTEVLKIFPILNTLRNAGINSEVYPEPAKIKKQMSYADSNKIPFVALVGEDEHAKGLITLKNMLTGEQEQLNLGVVIEILRK